MFCCALLCILCCCLASIIGVHACTIWCRLEGHLCRQTCVCWWSLMRCCFFKKSCPIWPIWLIKLKETFCLFLARQPPVGHGLLIHEDFLDHTQRCTTVGRTPMDEWSARRRDLYLTTHNTHSRQTSMLPVGLEPTIPTSERPQTYALDRAATGTG